MTGRDLAAGSIGATAPVLADALARPERPHRAGAPARRPERPPGSPRPSRPDAQGRGRRPRPSRPVWTTPRRVAAAAAWAWVVVPFGWGLYELVVKIPSLFG